jgi:class 3 adenylate cyclase
MASPSGPHDSADVAWAAHPDEAVHPIAGFAAAVEAHYLVELHRTVAAAVVVFTLYTTFLPVNALLGLREFGFGNGWATPATYFGVMPYAAVLLAAMIANAFATVAEVPRARRHDGILSLLAVVIIIAMPAMELEWDNECAEEFKHTNPDATAEQIRAACATKVYAQVLMLLMICVACNVRTRVTYPSLLAGFAALCISPLYLTQPTISTDSQIVVRLIVLGVIYMAVVAVAFSLNASNRASFLDVKKVVRLTEQAKETTTQINGLLEAMLPESVLVRMAAGEDRIFDMAKVASVSFSDVAGFTTWSSSRSSEEVVQLVSTLVSAYDAAAKECQVAKVKTIGDAYWAISGLPELTDESAVRICNFALRQQELLVDLNEKNPQWGGIELRVGCHTGPLTGGVIGTQQLAYEVFGETNHIAEQHEQNAPNGTVLVSRATMLHAEASTAFTFTQHHAHIATSQHDGEETFIAARNSAPAEQVVHQHRTSAAVHADHALGRRDDRANVMRFFGLGKKVRESTDASSRQSRSGGSTGRSGALSGGRYAAPVDSMVVPEEGNSNVGAAARLHTGDVNVTPDDDGEEADIDMVRVGCSQKFANRETEEAYYEFDHVAKHGIRQVANASLAAIGFAFLLAILIELPTGRYAEGTASMVIFAAVGSCFVGLFAISRFKTGLARSHGKAVYFAGYALACLYMLAVELVPQDLFVTDPLTIAACFVPLCYVSPPADVWLVFHLLAMALMLLCAVLASSGGMTPIFIFVLGIALATVWFGLVQNQRDRSKFKTKKLADGAAAEANAEEALQRQILASMAPAHVQDDMVALVTSDAYKAGEPVSISHTLQNVTVCFCKLKTKEEPDDAHDAYDDIMAMHQRVEACLEHYPLAIKIKSVGSMIVVAGPLHVGATQAESRAAAKDVFKFALDATHGFRDLDGNRGLAKRVGVSSGPVVASVMGTDRLAYDIFGDTVNTAARCMTTAPLDAMQSPMAQQQLYRDAGEAMPLGQVVQVAMKGKGDVATLRC